MKGLRKLLNRGTRPPIMWGIPCDEVMYSRFFLFFVKHSGVMPEDVFAISEGTYIPDARNKIHREFLKSNLPYLMMLDSDILFPPNLVSSLMAHDLPIVGGWYKEKKTDDHHPVIFDFLYDDEQGVAHWKHRDKPGSGLEKVDAMGAGCWLMRRDVAQALGEKPYDMNFGGEDMRLSRKLMKLGIPLHVDWSLNCAHLGVKHI